MSLRERTSSLNNEQSVSTCVTPERTASLVDIASTSETHLAERNSSTVKIHYWKQRKAYPVPWSQRTYLHHSKLETKPIVKGRMQHRRSFESCNSPSPRGCLSMRGNCPHIRFSCLLSTLFLNIALALAFIWQTVISVSAPL